jgi:hypothetical protein
LAKTRKRTKSTKADKPLVSPLVIVAVVAAALLVVGGLILLGTQSQQSTASAPADIDQFPSKGDSSAPVTIIEFSDYG